MALSKLNNWNAPLAAFGFPGDVFTGRPEATSGAAISVNIIASTHCTLTIEQSYNTTNWYYSNQLDISAGQLLTLQVPVVMPNFRVNVLNEEQVTQTYFNMNTSLVPQLTQNFNIRHLTPETDSVAVDLSGVTLEIGTTVNVGNFPALQFTYDASACLLLTDAVSVLTDISNNALVLPPVLDISGSVFVTNFPTLQDTYDASANVLLAEVVSVLTDISNNGLILPPVLDISGTVVVSRIIDALPEGTNSLGSTVCQGIIPHADGNPDVPAKVSVVAMTSPVGPSYAYEPMNGFAIYTNAFSQEDSAIQNSSILIAGKKTSNSSYGLAQMDDALNIKTVINAELPAGTQAIGSVSVSNFPALQDTYDASANVLLAEAVAVLTDISNNGLALPAVLDISGTVLTNAIDIASKSQVPLSSFAFDGGAQFGTINQLFTYSTAADPSGNPVSSIVACGIDDTAADGGVRGLPLTNPYINPITYRPFVRSYIEARNKQDSRKEGSSAVSYGRGRSYQGAYYEYLPLTLAPNRDIVDVSANELYVKDIDVAAALTSVTVVDVCGNSVNVSGSTVCEGILSSDNTTVVKIGGVPMAGPVPSNPINGLAIYTNAFDPTDTSLLNSSIVTAGKQTSDGSYQFMQLDDDLNLKTVITTYDVENNTPNVRLDSKPLALPDVGNANHLLVYTSATQDSPETGGSSVVACGYDGTNFSAIPFTTGGTEVKTKVLTVSAGDGTTPTKLVTSLNYDRLTDNLVDNLLVKSCANGSDDPTIEGSSSISYGYVNNSDGFRAMRLDTDYNLKTVINAALPVGSNAIGSVGLTASLNTATYNQAVTAGSFAGTTYTVGENSLVDVLLLATGTIISGTVRLEYSIDGTNWFPNNTTNYTISTADPHQTIIGLRTGSQYIRIGSVSTSTFRADNLNMTYSSKRN